MKKLFSQKFRKEFWLVILGFSLGGILWGWFCFDWILTHQETFTNPFSFILGAFSLALFGGLSLSLIFFKKSKKKFWLCFLLGFPAWILAFLLPGIGVYFLWLGSLVILRPFVILFILITNNEKIVSLLNLHPSLGVGTFLLQFFLSFFLITLFYALFFSQISKVKFLLLPPLFGALASIFSPLLANLLGFYLLHSLFLAYLLTFFFITFSFAFCLTKFIF